MAVDMKRKQPTEEVAPKSSKRQKSEVKSKSHKKTETITPSTKTPSSSILLKEQPAFPRGGGGLLTPLEKKQISARAARDAIAEQGRPQDLFSSKRHANVNSDSEEVESGAENEQSQVTTKKTKKRKVKDTAKPENAVAIEGLSYKRLAVGSLILGRISSINSSDLTISLPNNLSGFVPLTAISSTFGEKIQNALEEDKSDVEDGDEDNDSSDIDLDSHFTIGQYLRVAVTALGDEVTGKSQPKRKIILSIDPEQANSGLTRTSLVVGCTVQVAVTSIEDHGLVVDLGIIEGKDAIKGFIAAKALGPSTPLSAVKIGSVMLCAVSGIGSNGKIIKLSPDLTKSPILKNAPNVDAFLPGTPVEVLVSDITSDGIAGKVMGMLDVTADIVHSGSYQDRELFAEKHQVGQRLKARLISTFPLADMKKLGFSLLEDNVTASSGTSVDEQKDASLKVSAILPSARVVRVAPGLGIYLSLPSEKFGFAHISRLSDKKVETVSETTGTYKVGSEHKVRILDYNSIDGLYILSLQKSVLEQPFLRLEDVRVGETIKVTIEKILVGPAGVQGLIVNLAEGVTGMIPPIHMSDITLLHPEKKFKEGSVVTARVLSIDRAKKQSRLTLKKTLINNDQKIWTKFEDIEAGESTVGTLVKIDPHGALVQFYGDVRGFLPVAEMSEAYIKDATEHFKVGQVLSVNALSINAEERRLTVSCRDRGASIEASLASVLPGSLVSGTVFEKSQSDLLLRLEGSDVIARLALDHVSDGSEKKRRSALDKIRVGQKLENVLVLDVQRTGRLVILCNRQSLIKASQNGHLLRRWEDLKEGSLFTGYISNITEAGVFVRFASNINGLITKHQVPKGTEDQPDFGLTVLQAVTARVLSIDYRGATPRFWLTMRQDAETPETKKAQSKPPPEIPQLLQAADDSITSFTDLTVGKVTKARITSIKDTQINVELAKDIQGRIDVSEVFDQWEDIKDRKQPLRIFALKQTLPVRILGAHDTRNHRFLPLSHRAGKNTVFELSAKGSTINATEVQPLSLSDMQIGSSWLAFVNNIIEDHLMVNISPTVRGRIRAIDVSDDLSLASDLQENFPVGSAIKVQVKSVDLEKNHLDLSGKSSISEKPLTLQELSPGTILPGRVTKVSDRNVFVQLTEDIVGAVDLIDMADDYSQSNTAMYQKNDVIRVCVVRVDVSNKKVVLSTRASKVLSSTIKVRDPEITSIQQLKVGDIIRGFISNVADKGLFVILGHGITAFIRVAEISDAFLKSWKDSFQRDQLIKGKVIMADESNGHIQLSLKESVISGTYKPPVTFTSIKVGEIVTGKVVKVETFGVFVLVDNSQNVRGLCHRSEIAEQRVEDASKLFNQGDAVKVKILKLDLPNRKINFGMKAAYFAEDEDEEMEDVDDLSSTSEDGGAELSRLLEAASGTSDEDFESASDDGDASDGTDNNGIDDGQGLQSKKQSTGLSVGGFDWFGMSTDNTSLKDSANAAGDAGGSKQKKKKRKPEIQIDRTGDLDVNGPQSTDDFERLLLGEPDSSMLWLQYMAFHLELGDVDAARQIGERALKTIGLGQDSEKMNVWIALLNLENAYGDDETVDATFRRAIQYNDPSEIYNRLISIFIQSGKHTKADELFQEMLKKFTQDPKVYTNYASFLFDIVNDADKGRSQLARALQVLPSFTHFDLTSKFAQLEFKSSAGLAERGRTIFEGLINSFPKRVDLFNVLLDLEIAQGDKEAIRALFARIFQRKLKPKQAKYFFKRWLAFEEGEGDERRIEEVKAKAATWVKSQG